MGASVRTSVCQFLRACIRSCMHASIHARVIMRACESTFVYTHGRHSRQVVCV